MMSRNKYIKDPGYAYRGSKVRNGVEIIHGMPFDFFQGGHQHFHFLIRKDMDEHTSRKSVMNR